ncbi:hypothetical protein ACFU7Y_05165 [Kitasatospora sp. NPDC057542]|uniref:hypothetical protein n=1 Tax=Kitasatospora sp. NPDC057542 TaxID=3346162 RepID=UPI0036AF01A3
MSTRELSEERARLVAALLQCRADLLRTDTRPEGTSGPAELQRQQEEVDAVAVQLRVTTAELERRTAAATERPGPSPRNTPAPLAERQQTQTWHHRRTPLGDRHEEERHGMV